MAGADLSRYRQLGCFTSSSGNGWRDRALCAGRGPGLWYSRSRAERAEAVAICWECPVRRPCLADALNAETGHSSNMTCGIRGGLDARERDRMRAEARQRHG